MQPEASQSDAVKHSTNWANPATVSARCRLIVQVSNVLRLSFFKTLKPFMNTYTDNTKLVLLQEFQPKNAHLQKKAQMQ